MSAPPRVPIHTALHGPQLAGWQPSPAPQARHKVLTEPDVEIPLPDGTVLRGDVYRPDVDAPVPALLSWAAYNKDLLTTWVPAPFNETGVVGYLAACGYAVLIANPRGCGRSDGSFAGIFSEQEAADLVDTIDWLAGRPFCNGRVGMTGMSYFAVSQLRAAVRRPKHLGAIFPFLALTDLYRHAAYHGGSLHSGFLSGYISINGSAERLRIPAERRHLLGYALDTPVARALLPQVLPRVLPRIAPHLEPPQQWTDEFGRFAFDHPFDSDFYRLRSPEPALANIDIPVLIGSEWGYVALHLFGAFSAWHHVRAPKKLFIGPPGDSWPWARYQDELLAFYDRHLNGVDNGWDALPPVRYWLMGADR
ncbi:MAG TPA: CocE/NonD family hydrolase, partial [Acidimicrobiales bacterium]|nr:CocE/NonD family hydrolase [Acidimicrobiales bacterium]